MNEHQNERISAIMDGEIQPRDGAGHIRSIAADDDLKQTWHRYHLIRDVLQGHLRQDVDANLAGRVSDALENEPAILVPAATSHRRYLKPVAGLAIAASVTAAVLLGVQVANRQAVPDESTPAFASNATSQVPRPVRFVSSNGNTSQVVGPADSTNFSVESPMNRYLVNYNEHRVNSGMRAMLPYVRIVGHETNP